MSQIADRIRSLRLEIEEHNHRYYVLNDPLITDFEFDQKLKLLDDLEKQHPEYFDPLSPTQRVGSDLNMEFEQREHSGQSHGYPGGRVSGSHPSGPGGLPQCSGRNGYCIYP